MLANYSFVQLFKEDADKAINALNGYEYRGRKLSVSYSRQKDIDSTDDDSIPQSVSSGYTDQSATQIQDDEAAYAAAEKAMENAEGFSAPATPSGESNFLV